MDIIVAKGSIGSRVIAADEYWGTYTGILVEIFETRIATRAKVQIEKNIVYPSQQAILVPKHVVPREPYKRNSINSFDLSNINIA